MKVPGIQFDRPVQRYARHDISGPGVVATTRAQSNTAAANARASVITGQAQLPMLAFETEALQHDVEFQHRLFDIERSAIKHQGIQNLIKTGLNFGIDLWNNEGQKQLDEASLDVEEARGQLQADAQANRYRTVPIHPDFPEAGNKQVSNADGVTATYQAGMTGVYEAALETVSHPGARRTLERKWKQESVKDGIAMNQMAAKWKTEDQVDSLNTSIGRYQRLGQFGNAKASVRAAVENNIVSSGAGVKTITKLDQAEAMYDVQTRITSINAAGAGGGGKRQLEDLRTELRDKQQLIDLGPTKSNQILGTLRAIEGRWRDDATRARAYALLESKAGANTVAGQIQEIRKTNDITQSMGEMSTLMGLLNENAQGLTLTDNARSMAAAETVSMEMTEGHMFDLLNVESDLDAALEFRNWVSKQSEETLGLIPNGGARQGLLNSLDGILAGRRGTIKQDAKLSQLDRVTHAAYTGRLPPGDFDTVDALGAKVPVPRDEGLNNVWRTYLGDVETQSNRQEGGPNRTVSQAQLPEAGRLINNMGEFPPILLDGLDLALGSDDATQVYAASERIDGVRRYAGGSRIVDEAFGKLGTFAQNNYNMFQQAKAVHKDPNKAAAQMQAWINEVGAWTPTQKARAEEVVRIRYGEDKNLWGAVVKENPIFGEADDEETMETFRQTNPDFWVALRERIDANAGTAATPGIAFTNAYTQAITEFPPTGGRYGGQNLLRSRLNNQNSDDSPFLGGDFSDELHKAGLTSRAHEPGVEEVIIRRETDGIQHSILVGSGQALTIQQGPRKGDVFIYENRITAMPAYIEKAKADKKQNKKTYYKQGQDALQLIFQEYPQREPTHHGAILADTNLGGPESVVPTKDKLRNLALNAARKVAPDHAIMFSDYDLTRADEHIDKAFVKSTMDMLDAKWDRYIRDRFQTKGMAPSSVWTMRQSSKAAALRNIKHNKLLELNNKQILENHHAEMNTLKGDKPLEVDVPLSLGGS